MKRLGFLHGAGLAVALAFGGAATSAALVFSGVGAAPRVVLAGVALVYVVYLLATSPERIGRVTTLAVWLLAAAVLWLWSPTLILYLLLHATLIWLVRAFHHHGSLLAALADLGLGALALAAAFWAFASTGSLFAALWSYFLVQALFVAIPPQLFHRGPAATVSDDRFEQASRIADAAARRLATRY